MQLRKTGVILLALLLAAMAMVPYVSAISEAAVEDNTDLTFTIEKGSSIISRTIASVSGSSDHVEMNYVSKIQLETRHRRLLQKTLS